MQAAQKGRDYGFDNIRALLIVCVVFAHLLEIRSPFSFGGALYRIIYSFHMPVFLFICGLFAKFDRTKLLFGLLIPYLMLQTAYIFFQRWLYGTNILLQFTTPYWLLWFLLALFFYHLLLPLYDVSSPRKRLAAWLFAFVLSLAAGYDATVGYSMTLSRLLTFQPWFLLGFYGRNASLKIPHRIMKILILIGLILCVILLHYWPITNNMLYGSYPYATLKYHAGTRLFLSILALLWILFFCFVLKPVLSIRIPVITALGQNTLPVFLLHGFIVKYIGYCHPQILENPVHFLAITFGILLLLGNSLTAALFRCLLPNYWVKKFAEKRKACAK